MRGVVHSRKSSYTPKKNPKNPKKKTKNSKDFFWGFKIRTSYLGVNNSSISVFKFFLICKIFVHPKKSGKIRKKSKKNPKNPEKNPEKSKKSVHPIWEWTTPRLNDRKLDLPSNVALAMYPVSWFLISRRISGQTPLPSGQSWRCMACSAWA